MNRNEIEELIAKLRDTDKRGWNDHDVAADALEEMLSEIDVLNAEKTILQQQLNAESLRAAADRAHADAIRQACNGVANAIHVGAGGMIQGTLMEAEFRKALGLKKGELVGVPK